MMKNKTRCIDVVLFFLCLLYVVPVSFAETIYKRVDKDGNVTFSDKPLNNAKALTIDDDLSKEQKAQAQETIRKDKKSDKKTVKTVAFKEALQQELKGINKQLATLEEEKKTLDSQQKLCLARRKVARPNPDACEKKTGEEKKSCLKSPPVQYLVTNKENCLPESYDKLQKSVEALEEKRDEVLKDIAKIKLQ